MAETIPTKPSRGIGTETPPTNPGKPGARNPANPADRDPDQEHEGAREEEVGDRTGPAVGFDNEPEREKDTGGVS